MATPRRIKAPSEAPERPPAGDDFPHMLLAKGQHGDGQDDEANRALPSLPLGAEIRLTQLLFKSALHQRFRRHRVTSAQWAYLRILWNEDGLTQKELARRLGIHATTTVPALAILERNGYVRRARSAQDRRNVYVYLTDAGKSLAYELVPYAVEMNRRSLKGFTQDEADTLLNLLWRVQGNLQEALQESGAGDADHLESDDE